MGPAVHPAVDPPVDPTVDPSVDPTVGTTVDPSVHPTVDPAVDPIYYVLCSSHYGFHTSSIYLIFLFIVYCSDLIWLMNYHV